MTTLNTIIEEEKKEFDKRIDSENYETEEDGYGSLKTGSDTLLGESWYPESEYEIDEEKVKDFLTTAMQRAYEAGRADGAQENIYDKLKEEALDLSELHEVELGTPDTEGDAYSRGYKQGRFDSEMDRLNEEPPKPDTEWEKEFDAFFNVRMFGEKEGSWNAPDLFTMKRFISSTISSRDTYWKERVGETRTALLFVGEKVLKEMSEIYAVDIKYADKKQWLEPSEFERIFLHRFNEAGLQTLDTLLDNLK